MPYIHAPFLTYTTRHMLVNTLYKSNRFGALRFLTGFRRGALAGGTTGSLALESDFACLDKSTFTS